jgi:hypothetical protein
VGTDDLFEFFFAVRSSPVMSEHRIRFRGGWLALPIEGTPDLAGPLDLPVAWPEGVVGSVRLIRRFGRPPIDPAAISARIEFLAVPGLRSVQLNGVDLGRPPADVFDWSVPLTDSLSVRNVLTLDVVIGRYSTAELPAGWGAIALVLTPFSGSSP